MGKVALYHAGYRWSRCPICFGRLGGGTEPLLTRGKHPLRIKALA